MEEDDGHLPPPDGLHDSIGTEHDFAIGSDPTAGPSVMTPAAPVILVLGGPGTGKDTQCERLATKYGCAHLSAVTVLRTAVTSSSQTGTVVSNMIRSGQIVPAQVTLDLLKEEMAKTDGPYLVQGFPKNVENLDDLEAQCGAPAAVILLEALDEVLKERLLARGKTSNRTDDNPEAIDRRLQTFKLQASPMLERLRARGTVLSSVDAAPSQEQVFAAVCEVYERVTS